MAKQDNSKAVKDAAEKLVSLMGISGEVSTKEEEEANILVEITTEQAPILIGRHGETIAAFQTILNQIVYKLLGEGKRVLVDCGNWRTKQEGSLKTLAFSVAQRAIETGSPQSLFNLRSDERRLVHLALSEHPDVISESQGEGKERHIVIKPKEKTG